MNVSRRLLSFRCNEKQTPDHSDGYAGNRVLKAWTRTKSSSNRGDKHKKQESMIAPRGTICAMTHAPKSSSSIQSHREDGLAKLPTILQLEIMSFLYDDLESLGALFVAVPALHHIRHKDLKRHVTLSILGDSPADSPITSHNSDTILCRICTRPTCYPYKLVDASCGHQVCGRCAWNHRRGACGCGIKIRTRPRRLDPTLSNAHAYWLLSPKEKLDRWARNERPVHRGARGVFGESGVANLFDPFDGVGFESDFAYMHTLDVTSPTDILPLLKSDDSEDKDGGAHRKRTRKRWCITICPAHMNFSAYHVENFNTSTLGLTWPLLEHRQWWFETFSKDDVLLLEQLIEVPPAVASNQYESSWVRPLGAKEYRLVGWHHLAPQFGDYDY